MAIPLFFTEDCLKCLKALRQACYRSACPGACLGQVGKRAPGINEEFSWARWGCLTVNKPGATAAEVHRQQKTLSLVAAPRTLKIYK